MLAAVLLLLSVVTGSRTEAQDQASNEAAEKAVSSGPAIRQSRAEVLDYWTEERMENAKPVKISVRKSSAADSASVPAPQGPPKKIAPAAPSGDSTSGALSAGIQPAATTTRDGYTYPFPFTRYEVFTSYDSFPYSTNGKVFFTKPGVGNFVCSGTAVNSENKSVVWTAGHCVENGKSGGFHTNWVFVPALKDGANPFGIWTARELWTLKGWGVHGSLRYDLGAAIVNTQDEIRLVDVVGGQGIAWNLPYPQHWTFFGYPGKPPFNGERQQVCTASYARQDNPGSRRGPSTIGIGCDMTNGYSGGGWIESFSGGNGFVNSVGSYRPTNQPRAIYGPYHGTGARNLYNAVKNR